MDWKYIGLICILLLAVYTGPSSAVSTNLILNPGFESGTTYWSLYTDGSGSFLNDVPGVASPHAGHIKIIKPGTNVQLFQKGLVLLPDTLYQLNFKAYSNTGHDLSISLMKHGSPYTKYGLSNYVVNLGTTWKDYSIQFKSSGFSGTVTDARLMFWLAPYDAAGDQYFFDDVTLTSASVTPPTTEKPTITTQPISQKVVLGSAATMRVVATGTAPLRYQWQKNGVNIIGATGATYITPATKLSDSGSSFRVIVSNNVGSVTSNAATLTVISAQKQVIFLDVTFTHNTTRKAFTPFPIPPDFPDNLVSPIDYAHGTAYQRVQVITKPSNKIVQYQHCVFQDGILANKQVCTTASKLQFSSPGTYYSNQSMTSLFQYPYISWDRALLVQELIVKDSRGWPVDDRYGFSGKWIGSPDFSLYYPMKVRYTYIIVAPGGGEPVWPK
ncbi:Carbohydrate binding domain protein [uncultured archaeon]|nr:Carbohydrate binding domain protein [uncultured archaeon]